MGRSLIVNKTIAYIRVSTDTQNVEAQKIGVNAYVVEKKITVDQFFEMQLSSKKLSISKAYGKLLDTLNNGDTLIVSELSRLGRSVSEVTTLTKMLADKGVTIHFIKQNLVLDANNQNDISNKVIITMFSLMAELERDFISLRTKEGQAVARANGKKIGRPSGSTGFSKLDGKEDLIKEELSFGVSLTSICRKLDCTVPTLRSFIASRMPNYNQTTKKITAQISLAKKKASLSS